MIRKQLLALMVLMTSLTAFAATEPPSAKPTTFVFKYAYQGEKLEVHRQVASYEEAFQEAAQKCFDHFKKNHGAKMTEDAGLDIIDVCANPRP